ncbi:hypothetical protein VTK73DRAFT_5425 [Phialemonium thermophilum]|uniref:Uncharacterized protein n=1 Tax=Phialemonium thermophilum TaxID=223376 RepID=A0ABR3V1U9_9PEZI
MARACCGGDGGAHFFDATLQLKHLGAYYRLMRQSRAAVQVYGPAGDEREERTQSGSGDDAEEGKGDASAAEAPASAGTGSDEDGSSASADDVFGRVKCLWTSELLPSDAVVRRLGYDRVLFIIYLFIFGYTRVERETTSGKDSVSLVGSTRDENKGRVRLGRVDDIQVDRKEHLRAASCYRVQFHEFEENREKTVLHSTSLRRIKSKTVECHEFEESREQNYGKFYKFERS